jgi:hypothetical protein
MMAKEILLTHGKHTIVDDENYERLNQYKWWVNSNGYAIRTVWNHGHTIRVRMHHEILQIPKGMFIDHINGDKLDNRLENLRVCNKSENAANSKIFSTNKSGLRGVSWFSSCSKWRAAITVNRRQIHLGLFGTKEEASVAYKKAAKIYFGEFAREQANES